jgi:hypothetical protein
MKFQKCITAECIEEEQLIEHGFPYGLSNCRVKEILQTMKGSDHSGTSRMDSNVEGVTVNYYYCCIFFVQYM